MSTPDSSKAAWKELGLVVLPTFNTLYHPLCTLKISQHLGSRLQVKLWSEQPLSALKHSPQLQDSMPEVKGIRPLQKLSSRSEGNAQVSAEVTLALEAACGLTAGSNHGLELEFHSRGVMQRDLERCIRASDRADDWMQLTRDSRSLFGSPSCAIITEVWYARAVKEESGRRVAVNASTTVPAELVAGGVLPGGAASAGGAAAFDVGSSRAVSLEAAEFHPVAFQFVLLSWKNNQWVINDKPSRRPQTKGTAALEADKEQAAQWALEEPPGIAEELWPDARSTS